MSRLVIFAALCGCASQAAPTQPASAAPVSPALAAQASPAPAAPASPPAATSEFAPVPFPPGSLAATITEGLTLVYRWEQPGKDPYLQSTRFLVVSDEGCMIEDIIMDVDSNPTRPPRVSQARWDELEGHAQFPRADTTITERSLDTPAGRFDTMLYEVRTSKDGRNSVMRLWFAKTLPGPPVKVEMLVDGQLAMSSILIESHRP